MKAAGGLLVLILGVSHGLETSCDGRQDGAQCYGALGGTVIIQLMDDASEIPRYQWSKGPTRFLTKRNNIISNSLEDRSVFTPSNGTFILNKLSRSDGDKYTLELFDEGLKKSAERTLHLMIQAPVSSVQLTYRCLSQGDKQMSCSSEEADSPRYNWTLNGRSLTDAELLAGDQDTDTITLSVNVTGELLCLVYNDVSRASKVVSLPTCGYIFINCTTSNGTEISEWVYEKNNTLCVNPTTPSVITNTSVGKETPIDSVTTLPNVTSSNQTLTTSCDNHWFCKTDCLLIIAGVLSALVIFLLVGVAVICIQKKKQKKPEEGEDEEELIYADVRVIQGQRRKVEPRSEELVEYGEVKFSDRPRRTEAAGNDCLYSTVRTAR